MDPSGAAERRTPVSPLQLPETLAAFLREREFACLIEATDQGAVFIMKAPAVEIDNVRGATPVWVRHQVFDHPASPVIRTVLRFYDQPERPLAFEHFTNAGSPAQRENFAALAQQDAIFLLFFDEAVEHRLTKVVPNTNKGAFAQALQSAETLLAQIPPGRRDFDAAKAHVLRETEI
jgi:hypothetical protein